MNNKPELGYTKLYDNPNIDWRKVADRLTAEAIASREFNIKEAYIFATLSAAIRAGLEK